MRHADRDALSCCQRFGAGEKSDTCGRPQKRVPLVKKSTARGVQVRCKPTYLSQSAACIVRDVHKLPCRSTAANRLSSGRWRAKTDSCLGKTILRLRGLRSEQRNAGWNILPVDVSTSAKCTEPQKASRILPAGMLNHTLQQ